LADGSATGVFEGNGATGAAAAASTRVADAFVSIAAITVPTSTVSPSGTIIFARVPAAGDGISESTLSVLISRIDSSFSIFSPGFFIQRRIFPS
jgi:hypothetical protein